MDSCWKCGTYAVFTRLIRLIDRIRFGGLPVSYKECEDERECMRREQMKMGEPKPDPFKALGL